MERKVAILVADGFEQVEMTKPREALHDAGAETKIVSPSSGQIQGMNHADKGDKFDVDIELKDAHPEEFDALDDSGRFDESRSAALNGGGDRVHAYIFSRPANQLRQSVTHHGS